ncbi:hypothetical protein OG782_35125 [Streptomyces sp. NBC_00876]|uniref:phage tail protein n=1 Tax=Streptomyces sp. NBC_00876 TaxID=2975853 RepID=UPI003866145A|nr:hypothetical protein OG782_35125 [Streptomyces sp. NBC_00876]
MKAVPEKTSTAPARTEAAPRTDRAPTSPSPAPDRRSIQRLQRAAGNAAVSRLVAQRYTAPVKSAPAQAPGFRSMKAAVAAKKTRIAVHPPAAAESKASQDAAVAPPDDKEAQGKAANAEKMNAAKPGEFDKKAFVDAVNKAIDAQAPKNLDEADKFSKSGKAEKVKAEVDGKVTDGKESSAKDIDTATKAPPDTSAAKDKPVTPLTPDQPPGNPGAPPAADAIPDKQPASVTDFSEGPAQNDKEMADAEVTEDQLAKGNEPEFNEALSAKKTAETDSAKAPAKGQAAENQQLNIAKAGAAASGAAAMSTLTATRAQAGQKVDGGKGETKSKDERKRAEVTAKLQKVYDGTKKDVETTLSDLDKKVDTAFTAGEKAARDAFTADHKRRMKKYKDKRYSGWTGKARWVKDKFAGLPQAANDLYQEARKLYVAQMQTVISSVADIIGAELGKAKARIAKGRTELKAEVDKLPADLRQFGEDAAKDFAGKFDDLETTVNEKSEQLVQDLASKYTAALNKIDEEIKKLQEANKGLIDKAKDAIVGAIKTINELKNLLLGILAKAAGAIMKIIKDPIGFLGNLVSAVGAGLNLFVTNIAEHLKTGVVSWLLGTAVKAGLDLPQKFDLKGIIQLIGSLLGLTWDNIKARVTRKGVPDEAMAAVETSVPVAQKIAREGPAGAFEEIKEEAGDLKATILEKLTSYLIPTVIVAGITWIISLLNPASAFVRAVKGIIDIVTFIVNQGSQIVEFVNSVLDAVVAIANGGKAGVPKMVEAALAASVPLLIGFLASLLGIGGLANKVKSVFHAVGKPVGRAIDKIVDFIVKKGKALWRKLKGKGKDGKGKEGKEDGTIRLPKKRFSTETGDGHLLNFSDNKQNAKLMIHSTPLTMEKFLSDWREDIDKCDEPTGREVQSKAHIDATNRHDDVKTAQDTLEASAGAARQQHLQTLVGLLDKLAVALAKHDPGMIAPIPAPILPPFTDHVIATKFTAHYINNDSKGEPSSKHKKHDGVNNVWKYMKTLNTGANQTAWVKMHLLPDFLGGFATDSNLVPARGFVNNPLFLIAAENPAKSALKPPPDGTEKIIWYRVSELTYHKSQNGEFPDDAFPHQLGVEWGGYERSEGKWTAKSMSGSYSDEQDPPTLNLWRINKEGATAAALRLGLPKKHKMGEAIKNGRPYSGITELTVKWPDFADKFTDLESRGIIRWD